MLNLERIYGIAGRELRTMLLSTDITTLDGAKIEDIKRKARRIVAFLNGVSSRWARQVTRENYAKAEKRTKDILWDTGHRLPRGKARANAGPDIVRAKVEVALLKATGSIMATVERYLSAALEAGQAMKNTSFLVQEFRYAEAADVIDEMASEAMRQEMSRGELIRRLREFLADLIEDENFIQIGNRMYRMNKYAEMVARTTLRDSQTAATLDVCDKYENDLVQVSDHATDCELCEQFEGKIYSISGDDFVYPKLDEDPPFHPNCKHSILPISLAEIRVRERERIQ